MVQSVAGKLLFITNCIAPARKFIARILAVLRGMQDDSWVTLGADFRADITWFFYYARMNNGIFYYTPERPEVYMECDSSMYGGGGVSAKHYYAWTYSENHMERYKNIVHLEAINLLVMYKTFAPYIVTPGVKVVIFTDNHGSSLALETGRTKDATLAKCAREMWLLATNYKCVHKMGKDIQLADALSRQAKDRAKAHLARQEVLNLGLTRLPPAVENYNFFTEFL